MGTAEEKELETQGQCPGRVKAGSGPGSRQARNRRASDGRLGCPPFSRVLPRPPGHFLKHPGPAVRVLGSFMGAPGGQASRPLGGEGSGRASGERGEGELGPDHRVAALPLSPHSQNCQPSGLEEGDAAFLGYLLSLGEAGNQVLCAAQD